MTFNEALDSTLPGSGFSTVSFTVPVCAVVEVPVAVSWVGETKVVVRGAPPKITWEPLTNFAPTTVREKLPTGTEPGVTLCGTGIGFWSVSETLPERVVSATLAAWMVTEFGLGRVCGAG